jgi:hypothetical protein
MAVPSIKMLSVGGYSVGKPHFDWRVSTNWDFTPI